MQPYFRIIKLKGKILLEVIGLDNWRRLYKVTKEELPVIEKLFQRDFKTAILYRRHTNEGIAMMADDIIEQKG